MFDSETGIREWKDHLRARGGISDTDIEELDTHLREGIADLAKRGLTEEEAFLIAVKRLGTADALAGEFTKVNAESLWKQLLLVPEDPAARAHRRREVVAVVLLALLSALLIKLPELLGYPPSGAHEILYLRNLCFFVLPSVVVYLAWKRSFGPLYTAVPAAALVVVFAVVLASPWLSGGQTAALTALHLPIALWPIMCLPYAGPRWTEVEGRMDFVRTSGEMFIYAVLVGLGGGVLVAFTQYIFASLGLDATRVAQDYLLLMGGAATPVVALFLVESKRSIVENLAPVLARIFTPLFLAVLLVFVVAMPLTGRAPRESGVEVFAQRDFLIAFDVMLALVLGLVLYTLSAHREEDRPGLFDYLGLALIVVALVADGVALVTMAGRLTRMGITPNRLAALGENLVLLVNLGGLAVLSVRYLAGKSPYRAQLRWQTAYLPVYVIWAAIVALVFPPIFGYR